MSSFFQQAVEMGLARLQKAQADTKKKPEPFDPYGSGYDEATAEELRKLYPLTMPKPSKPWEEGQPRSVRNEGAFEAWEWHDENKKKKEPAGWYRHGSSRDPRSGLLLKGKLHDTWDLLEAGEAAAGYEIYKKDGRYYSRKKE